MPSQRTASPPGRAAISPWSLLCKACCCTADHLSRFDYDGPYFAQLGTRSTLLASPSHRALVLHRLTVDLPANLHILSLQARDDAGDEVSFSTPSPHSFRKRALQL